MDEAEDQCCRNFAVRYCRAFPGKGSESQARELEARPAVSAAETDYYNQDIRKLSGFLAIPQAVQTPTSHEQFRSFPHFDQVQYVSFVENFAPMPTSAAMNLPPSGHEPVLLTSVLAHFDLQPGMVVVDCTLGRGGHAREMLARIQPKGILIGLDADPRNLEFVQKNAEPTCASFRFFHANFAELAEVLKEAGVPKVDRVLADLGLSTNQLFDERYGLSFQQDMPLDMRIDPRDRTTAADLVNNLDETALANVLYELAQERYSRRIARKIGEARRSSPITSTERLAELVRSAIPSRHGSREKIDPATRTFLALRMAVNHEMKNLETLLKQAPQCLAPGGRLAVISFQSMEDRMVKQAFRNGSLTGRLREITRKPIGPDETELAANPRSRSAKLRVAEVVA